MMRSYWIGMALDLTGVLISRGEETPTHKEKTEAETSQGTPRMASTTKN